VDPESPSSARFYKPSFGVKQAAVRIDLIAYAFVGVSHSDTKFSGGEY